MYDAASARFVVVRAYEDNSVEPLARYATFGHAMLYARMAALQSKNVDVLDCTDPNACVALVVDVGDVGEYVTPEGAVWAADPSRPANLRTSRRRQNPIEDQSYDIFSFSEHRFTVTVVSPDGFEEDVSREATFGQAMLSARSLAHIAARQGKMLMVLGCVDGVCGMPLAIDVGTYKERILPQGRRYVANPRSR